MTIPSEPSPAMAPLRPRRPLPRAKTALFAALAVTLAVGLAASLLLAFNLRWLRLWLTLRRAVKPRLAYLTMATYPDVATPERRDHLRACFKDPASVDFNKIPWGLICRPTPFLGYAPEPGDQGEGHFNAQQMRNQNDVALPKPAGVYRIFLTGGSQAYGAGAPSSDVTIAAYLERLLNEHNPWPGRRVEVFNTAVCGWASTHERILIENRLYAMQPDLVLALTGANDVHWAFSGADIQFLRTYEDRLYFDSVNAAMAWTGAKTCAEGPPWISGQALDPGVVAGRFVRNMRLAALALEPAGARLVVALQPTLSPAAKKLSAGESNWLEKKEDAGKVDYLERCFAAMDKALRTADPAARATLERNPANLQTIPVRDVFASRSDAIFFDLFHMGDKGNELLARRLAEELNKIK